MLYQQARRVLARFTAIVLITFPLAISPIAGLGVAHATSVSAPELISKSSGGGESDQGVSGGPHMSDDGRYVAYMSLSNNLVGQRSDANAVYVYDRVAHTTILASVDSSGVQEDGVLNYFELSGDGRHVVFVTNAHSLDPNAGGDLARWSIYVRNLDTGITTLVSVNTSGQRQYISGNTLGGFVSYDARFIVYEAMDIVNDDYVYTPYLRDMNTDHAQVLPIQGGQSYQISRDGGSILYWRQVDATPEVYDIATGQTKATRFHADGSDYSSPSVPLGISQDGSRVVLVGYQCADPSAQNCILYSDLNARTTIEVNDPNASNATSFADVTLSSDGQKIAYVLYGPSDGESSLYVYSVDNQERTLIKHDPDGRFDSRPIKAPSLSGSGQEVSYIESTSDSEMRYEQIFANTIAWGGDSQDTTPPSLGAFSWSANPMAILGTTMLSVPASDDSSGVAGGEYFVGNDPGQGHATSMTLTNGTLNASFGSALTPGIYQVGARAVDNAGNWSAISTDYLVVYDPNGMKMKGKKDQLAPTYGSDVLPGLIASGQSDVVKLAFLADYSNGQINQNKSDFKLQYKTGIKCNKPAQAQNCHVLTVDSTSITWLVIGGPNNSHGTIAGTANVIADGVTTSNPFRVEGVDGARINGTTSDHVVVKIYNVGANPDTASPLYILNDDVTRGSVAIQ